MDLNQVVALFQASKDPLQVNEVTPHLLEFESNPQAPLICLQIFAQYTSDLSIQKAALVYLVKSIGKIKFTEMDPQMKSELWRIIAPIINQNLSPIFYSDFSAICSLYLNEDFSLYPNFYEHFPKPFTLCVLSAIIENLSPETILSNTTILELSLIGLQDQSYLRYCYPLLDLL